MSLLDVRRFFLRVPFHVFFLLVGGLFLQNITSSFAPLITFLFSYFIFLFLTFFLRFYREESHVFLDFFSFSCFLIGFNQMQGLYFFSKLQTTIDAANFFRVSTMTTQWERFADIRVHIDGPLAVNLWRSFFHAASSFGIEPAPWLGLLLNSMVVSLSCALIIYTTRILFPDGKKEMKRVAFFCFGCGIFFIFSSIMVRDSFCLLLNIFFVATLLSYLSKPSLRRFFVALLSFLFCFFAMLYIREEAVYILLALFLGGLLLPFFQGGSMTPKQLFFSVCLLVLLVVAGFFLAETFIKGGDVFERQLKIYTSHSTATNSSDSLGMQFIVNQPWYLRFPLACGYLFLFPTPFWVYWNADFPMYHWFMGLRGIFWVLFFPLFAVSIVRIVKNFREQSTPVLFLFFHALSTSVAVGMSTGEPRHQGQFLFSTLILMAIPNKEQDSRLLTTFYVAWAGLLLFLYISYHVLKM